MLICVSPQEMHVLVPLSKTTLDISDFFLAVEYGDMPKVAGTLRQRYPECRAASKVFNRPRLNIAL
jgi:hypothetical protein